jgi:hypothetical protein
MDRERFIEVVRASLREKILEYYACIVCMFFMFIWNWMLLGARWCWTSSIALVRFGVLEI